MSFGGLFLKLALQIWWGNIENLHKTLMLKTSWIHFSLTKHKNKTRYRKLRKIYKNLKLAKNQTHNLLKISWRYIYFSGCPTYLPVVLNVDLCIVICVYMLYKIYSVVKFFIGFCTKTLKTLSKFSIQICVSSLKWTVVKVSVAYSWHSFVLFSNIGLWFFSSIFSSVHGAFVGKSS